ncbi:MAG: M6 family metalloprotease domain-containing protein [Planctomycetes bacterium]|nr:M6 family metalloprotease domain-containing protein [Planctomycetota bacterium]
MPSLRLLLGLTFLSVLILQELSAVPASGVVADHSQPDNSVFRARQIGDELWHAIETDTGYTLLRDSSDWWCVAEKQGDGTLAPGATRYSGTVAQGTAMHLRPDAHVLEALRAAAQPTGGGPIAAWQPWAPGVAQKPVGTRPALVILVAFADRSLTISDSAWSGMVFGATNSVAHYFSEVSAGQFTLSMASETSGTTNDGVVRVTLSSNHPNTASSGGAANLQAARDAFIASNSVVDYSVFDTNSDGSVGTTELAIFVVFAGFSTAGSGTQSPSVWPHQRTGGFGVGPILDGVSVCSFYGFADVRSCGFTTMGELLSNPIGGSTGQQQETMGTLCHEYGHEMGLPDLYDTTQVSEGLGYFCLMSAGSWNLTSGPAGTSPAHPSAWCRWQLGWATMVDATVGGNSLGDAATAAAGGKLRRVRISGNDSEFFLIENRNGSGYDAGLPSSSGTRGLLVYHVDHTRSGNTDASRYLVDLEEASSVQHLQAGTNTGDGGDYWRSGTQTSFSNTSTPDSKENSGQSTGISISSISAAGATVTFNVSFVPRADVQRPTGVSIIDGGTDTVIGAVTGTGSVLTYTVANLSLGASLDVTGSSLSNFLNCTAIVSASPFPVTLVPGGQATFDVTVTPAAAGLFGFDLSLATNDTDRNPYNVSVSGTVGPQISICRPVGTTIPNGGTDVIANAVVGSPMPITYTILNLGSAPLTVSSASVTGTTNCSVTLTGAFPSVLQPLTGQMTFQVIATPVAAGQFDFNIEVLSSDTIRNPYDFSGVGAAMVAPDIDVRGPAGASIQNNAAETLTGATAGSTRFYNFTIVNTGSDDLTIGVVTVRNPVFCTVSITAAPATTLLSPSAQTFFSLSVFTPAAANYSFEIEVISTDPDENPFVIFASGTVGSGGSGGGGSGGSGGGGCAVNPGHSAHSLSGWLALLAVLLGMIRLRKPGSGLFRAKLPTFMRVKELGTATRCQVTVDPRAVTSAHPRKDSLDAPQPA